MNSVRLPEHASPVGLVPDGPLELEQAPAVLFARPRQAKAAHQEGFEHLLGVLAQEAGHEQALGVLGRARELGVERTQYWKLKVSDYELEALATVEVTD